MQDSCEEPLRLEESQLKQDHILRVFSCDASLVILFLFLVMETAEGRAASLAALTRSRKQVDSDAQLLSNRIKLLQLEEQKTLKKIQETRHKAQAIYQAQRRERAQVHLSEQLQAQKQRVVSQKHARILQFRDGLKLQRHKSLEALVQRKRRQALTVKSQLVSDRQKQSALQVRLQEVNLARVKGIQQDRQEAHMRIKSQQSRKLEHIKEGYNEQWAAEERRMRAREQAVVDMELVEMELIERLKMTQLMQQEADKELDTVLSKQPRSLRSTC